MCMITINFNIGCFIVNENYISRNYSHIYKNQLINYISTLLHNRDGTNVYFPHLQM